MKKVVPLFKGIFSSWWVILFIALSLGYHANRSHKQGLTHNYLQKRIQELKQQKSYALNKKEELLLEINSQHDPAFVEMVLMKGLGVVPEGVKKVYFTEE